MRFRSIAIAACVVVAACKPSAEQAFDEVRFVSPDDVTAPDGSIAPTPAQALPAKDGSCEYLQQPESNTIFSYHDQEHGVTFSVPFNADWHDNEGSRLLPVEKVAGEVVFGARRFNYNSVRGICEPRRDFSYAIHPGRTAAQAERSYESQYVVDRGNVTIDRIGDHQVVIMKNMQGSCAAPLIEIIGTRENLLFTISCGSVGHIVDPLQELGKIVRTVDIEGMLQ